MGYLKRTIKGTGWIGSFRAISRGIAFAKIAIIARILTPAQFGVYGIATLVLLLLEIFTETGINTVLIQEKSGIKKYVDTAWVISIFRGTFMALMIVVSAPFVSRFFNSPAAFQILLLVSAVPFIRGFINPSSIKFQKELNFRSEFLYRIVIFFFDAFVAVIATLITRSELGLVYGFIAGALLELIISFTLIKPRPRLNVRRVIFEKIIRRGKWITVSGIFEYLFSQGDDIVVGKMLGESALGVYQNAYKLSTLPVSEVADVVGKVTFPVYVKISGDKKRLTGSFLKTLLVSIIAVSVIGGILYFYADIVVALLLGDGWLAVVPVLKVLSLFGVLKAISTSFNSLFLSMKKQNYVTIVKMVSFAVLAVLILPFVHRYGYIGAGYAAIFGVVSSLPISFYFYNKLMRL